MQPRAFSLDNVQLDSEIEMPQYTKQQLRETALKAVNRHTAHFNEMRLHMHIKREGSQIGCHAHLTTDNGHFEASSIEWGLEVVVDATLAALEAQLQKYAEKHTHRK